MNLQEIILNRKHPNSKILTLYTLHGSSNITEKKNCRNGKWLVISKAR